MKVNLKLGIPYKDIIGKEEVVLTLKNEKAEVSEIVDKLLDDSEIKEKLINRNLIANNKLKALYVLNEKLVDEKAIVNNDDMLKLLFPMAGG